MKFRTLFMLFFTVFLIEACSSNSSKTPEKSISEVEKVEIEQLDSLSNNLEQAANEIEQSKKALEETLKELDN